MIKLGRCHLGAGVDIGPGSVVGVMAKATAANRRVLEQSEFDVTIIGDRTVIGACCVIYRGAKIGNDCRLGDHATIREGVVVGDRSVIGTNADLQYGCLVGSDVRIMNTAHISGGTVVGDGTFIGPGVMSANDRHVNLEHYDNPKEGRRAPIIGKRVMIGVGAILLPGVEIGDGAVIGAGAVVTQNVAAGATVLGMPARSR